MLTAIALAALAVLWWFLRPGRTPRVAIAPCPMCSERGAVAWTWDDGHGAYCHYRFEGGSAYSEHFMSRERMLGGKA